LVKIERAAVRNQHPNVPALDHAVEVAFSLFGIGWERTTGRRRSRFRVCGRFLRERSE
jgi:hypothetical protein